MSTSKRSDFQRSDFQNSDSQSNMLRTVAGAAGVAALLGFLVAPRNNHTQWKVLKKYRYAHRGLFMPPKIPENSLNAFRRAAQHGFGAELDVHFTRDLRLAVVHDSDLFRVTGKHGIVEELTSEELESYTLKGSIEKIPYLEQVLPIFEAAGLPLIVEIKPANGNYNRLTAATVACLDQFRVPYCMESFDPHVLLYLKKHRPEIVRGQLSMNYFTDPCELSWYHKFLLTNLLYNFLTRPDFIAYDYKSRKNPLVLLCCHVLKGQEINWTIRSCEELVQAEKEGHLPIFEGFVP